MSATLERLGIDRMTIMERMGLAQEILDSVIAEQRREPLTEAKQQELDRRIADLKANPEDGIPWAKAEAAAITRFAP